MTKKDKVPLEAMLGLDTGPLGLDTGPLGLDTAPVETKLPNTFLNRIKRKRLLKKIYGLNNFIQDVESKIFELDELRDELFSYVSDFNEKAKYKSLTFSEKNRYKQYARQETQILQQISSYSFFIKKSYLQIEELEGELVTYS